MKTLRPYLILLVEVLLFFYKIIFRPSRFGIPWDLAGFHLPMIRFMAESFRNGHLPLWEPNTYAGYPIYADLTLQLFYPPTVLCVLISNGVHSGRHLLYFLELQIVLHVLLGGVFAYRLLRKLGLLEWPSLAGATVFQLGPFFASQVQHLGAIDAAAWLPLAFLALVELGEGFAWRSTAKLAIALAGAVLAGFPAVTAVVFVACVQFSIVLFVLRRGRWALFPGLALGGAFAAALTAVQLLPTLEVARLSVARYRGDWLGGGGGHPVAALISLVRPNYFGVMQFDSGTWHYPWNPLWLYLYCSLVGLVCIGAALCWWRNRMVNVFALLAASSLFWMLGQNTPVGLWVFRALPYSLKAPLYAEYALPFFALTMAVLAGFGAERLVGARSTWLGAALVFVIAADLISVAGGTRINTGDYEVEPGVAHEHMDGRPEIPDTMRRLVNQNAPPWRVDTKAGSIHWAAGGPLYDIPTANGNQPFALERTMQVRLSFCQGERWGRYYEIDNLASPLVDFLNVRYIVTRARLDEEAARAGMSFLRELPGQTVYENPEALPRFYLVHRIRPAADMAAAISAIRSPSFDPRVEAVVEDARAFSIDPAGGGEVRVLRYSPLRVRLAVQAPKGGYLVSSETHYPGWSATVDGAFATLYMTNGAFRGLPVPAGAHTVEMTFSPPVLPRGAAVSALAWIGLGLLAWRTRPSTWKTKPSVV